MILQDNPRFPVSPITAFASKACPTVASLFFLFLIYLGFFLTVTWNVDLPLLQDFFKHKSKYLKIEQLSQLLEIKDKWVFILKEQRPKNNNCQRKTNPATLLPPMKLGVQFTLLPFMIPGVWFLFKFISLLYDMTYWNVIGSPFNQE